MEYREFKQLTSLIHREFLKDQFTIVQVIQPALAERLSQSWNFAALQPFPPTQYIIILINNK